MSERDASPASALDFLWRRRLPLILQSEAAECGLVCLAMVASHLGRPLDIGELRRNFAVSLKGTTLKDLVTIADRLGLAGRAVRLELDELALLRTPAILHWDLNHFVVLRRAGRKSIVIHDPAAGIVRLTLAQASEHFTGVALELTPCGGFAPAAPKPPRLSLRTLVGRFVGVRAALAQLLALALALEIFAMVSPLFLAWVVDQALPTGDRGLLMTLGLGFSLLLVLQCAVSAMRGWMLVVLGASLSVQARINLFSHLVRLPTRYFETRYLADILSRFGSQETILKAITSDLVVALLDGVMATLTLAIMLVFSPLLALVVAMGAALYGLLRWASYRRLRQAAAETIQWSARRDGHFLETLRGITAIKVLNAEERRRAHWLNLTVETANRQLATQKVELVLKSANTALSGALAIVVIWIGADHVLDDTLSVGMLMAFIAYKDQFLRRVGELVNKACELKMLRLHGERLADIALHPPEPRDDIERAPPARRPAVGGTPRGLAIEARNLAFRYGDADPWVLHDLSFRVAAGECVAIVGASGCGKTTLLKLMAGLLEPTQGGIYVDGVPLPRLGRERYRAMLGVVMQDDPLFAGSIADNIAFFTPGADPRGIEHAARRAAIHDDIRAMPMGYETLTRDMGTVLSGGQKQRVLIARALFREPELLLLDEATSHLDAQSESVVNTALAATRATRIVIAHRSETIRACDRAIVLDAAAPRQLARGTGDARLQQAV